MIQAREKIILGIDPGTNVMGYGVLKNMGLTPREIEVVQAEWKKDDERTAAIAEQKRKEKEIKWQKKNLIVQKHMLILVLLDTLTMVKQH